MSRSIADLFRKIIIENELFGNLDHITKFSDSEGVRSGKGLSFGVSRFTVANNWHAKQCLIACGFSQAEIEGIRSKTIDVKPLEAKLRDHAMVVAKWDERQLTSCLQRAYRLMEKHGVILVDDAALMAVADYNNQFRLSERKKPDNLIHYLAELNRPITAEDVLEFRLNHTAYGKERPDDCRRRYNNILKIMRNS